MNTFTCCMHRKAKIITTYNQLAMGLYLLIYHYNTNATLILATPASSSTHLRIQHM
jgi:hypothetical protein